MQNTAELCRVGVRIPPFYIEKPALWFAQLEAQFMLSGVTADTTKFYFTMAQLDPQYAAEVEDIITNPPAANKYEKLKTELVKRLSATRERDIQHLSHEELGDRKPSQLLRRMQHLAGPGVPEDLMRTMWTNRLPQNIQVILASQTRCSLEELAELADKVHDAIASVPQVTAVQPTAAPASDPLVAQIAALSKQMEALTSRMDRMSREPRQSRPQAKSTNRSRSRSRYRPNSTRSNSNHRKFPTCWYHYKFGSEARTCVKPCDYSAGNA